MSKKLILFLMLAVFGSTSLLKAEEVTIGDPTGTTTNNYLPTYSLYNYSLTQQIYTAEEIGMAGTINSLTMWLKNPSTQVRNVEIYMKNVSNTSFEGLDSWVTMEASDLVCTSTIEIMSSIQEVTFTLDTPFGYDGESSLVVCFRDMTGSWKSGVGGVVFGTTSDPTRALYAYRDGSAYDLANPGEANGSTVNRDVVRLEISKPGVSVTPAELNLGARPNNGWMEPATLTVKNTDPAGATVTTSFLTYANAFNVQHLNEYTLGYKESVDVEVKPAANYVGSFEAVFAATFSLNSKDMATSTVTGEYYTAPAGDIVETAIPVTFYDGYAELYTDMSAMRQNYNLPLGNMKDVVYSFTTSKFMNFGVGPFTGKAVLYKGENGVCHPMADNYIAAGTNGLAMTKIAAGTYYLVLATNEEDFGVAVMLEDMPALTQVPTLVSPANQATEVPTITTLEWTLPEGTAEYRVLFNTIYSLPESTSVIVDWTGNLATTFALPELNSATQYFWQVQARNADGTVVKKSAKGGFTTTIAAPTNLTSDDYTVFEGDNILLKWKGGAGGGFTGEWTVCDGTATNSYVPVYGLYTDAYLKCNMVYPAEMLEEMEGGEITSMKFYLSSPASAAWDPANFTVYMMEVPGTTIADFVDPSVATVVYTGSLNGTGTEMVVTFDTPYEYEGGNLLVGINNTVIGSYKSCSFLGVDAPGACVQGYSYSSLSSITPTQRNFLPKTTFVCGGAKGDRSFLGFNVYKDNEKVNSSVITEKKYTVGNLTYNMEGYNFGVTCVWTEGESAQCPNVNVKVSGNGAIAGHVYDIDGTTPLVGATITLDGKDEFGDEQTFTSTTGNGGIYFAAVKAGTYTVTASLPEFSDAMANNVVITYANTTELDFIMHENYNPAGEVFAEEIADNMSKVSWTLGTLPGGAGDEFEFGFENDLEGWTNIDNDGDGHMWYHSSGAGDHSTLAITSHTGAGHVMGESYCNASWAALTPDDYLVTPQKYNIGGSSVLTFWACAQDASYAAEHFGVAISTASNTSAADFTTVAEWTLTAKGGTTKDEFAKKEVRGMSTREGSWYQYSVDLSAYGGQQAWIAIRHFNCSDQFIMCVDDVTMMNADRGNDDRSLLYYTVYRQQTMEEGATAMIPEEELNPEVVLAQCPDTAWVDFNWGNMETGVYQYGVQVTYGGNHRDNRETVELVNENFNEGMPEGWTNTSEGTNYWIVSDLAQGQSAYEGKSAFCNGTWQTGIKSYLATPAIELTGDEASLSFVYRQANWGSDQNTLSVVYGDNAEGPWTEIWSAGEVSVTEWTDMTIDLTGIEASYIAFCNYNDYGYATGVDNVVITASKPDSPITAITWSNMLPKNMDMNLDFEVETTTGADVRGAIVTLTNTSEPYLGLVYEVEMDSTGLYSFEGFRKGSYDITVELPGYAAYAATEAFWADATYTVLLQEAKDPVTGLAVSSTGYAYWTAPAAIAPESYLVMLNGVSQGQTEDTYMILNVENLVEGQTYEVKVAALYGSGMSGWETASFSYRACDNFESGIEDVFAFTDCMDVTFSWGGTPVPPTPPTPGEGDEFTEGFEGGLNGWNVLTVLSEGGSWIHSNNNLGGYDYTALAHGGSGFAMCYSFVDYVGSYNTDSYMYTPQKYNITTGSTLTFWADNANDSYPENFSVCVATADNPQASDFTQVWSGGAKGGNAAKVANRHNATRYENWRQHTIDLSSYAGQAVYIAFHDVNYDMYEIWIDDVELSVGGKGNRAMWDRVASFSANGAGEQGIATDGQFIYTSSWSGYPGYDFGKYTLDGSFVEGFSISGATGVRDLTYDGQYFYGSSGSSQIYILDLANKTKIGQINCSGATTRHCTYDPVRDAFWTGNWSDLALYDRNGSMVQSAPSPSSAYGSGYFKDADGVEHLYLFCQPNSDAKVYDYNITTGVLSSSPVFDFSQTPGFASDGISGGSFVGNYNGMTCWFGNAQQDPNLIGIYELGAAVGPTPGPGGPSIRVNSWALFLDGEFVECVDLDVTEYAMTMEDTEEHNFTVVKVDENYNMSCGDGVDFVAGGVSMPENLEYTVGEDGVTLTWLGVADSYKVYAGTTTTNLVMIGETTELSYVAGYGYGAYGVRAVTECGESDMAVIVSTGVNEIDAETRIYPNPTMGDIRIEAAGMKQITIVNTIGQVVYSENVNTNEMTVNMSQFGAGMYIVNIITENGTSAQRISVIK